MLSVIIINSEYFERYQKYAYFFNWFEDHSNIVICPWNKQSSDDINIDEMVPKLFDAVKNVSEWNAYIVDEPFESADYIESDFILKTQYSINPYERSRTGADFDPNKDLLLKLVYSLGGRGVEKLEYLNCYKFRTARPTYIYLITPRIFEDLYMQQQFLQHDIEAEYRRSTLNSFTILSETHSIPAPYSDFWERYDYPTNCRFFVFDLPDFDNSRFEDSWFLLWLSVISIAINSFTSIELRICKLYKLGIDISSDGLESFLNRFHTALQNACDASRKDVENEIAQIKAAISDTSSSDLTDCVTLYVNFPRTDFSVFIPKEDKFGYVKDKPKLDITVWDEHKERSDIETTNLFKAIIRGKNEAIESMKQTLAADISLLTNLRLSRYDAEDINEKINTDEIEMLTLETDKRASRRNFDKCRTEASNEVEYAMIPRVYETTFKKTLFTGILLCLLGFLPFIISSAQYNITSCIISLLITAFACAIVALTCHCALRVQRRRFISVIRNYCKAISAGLSEIESGAQIQSRYLTLLLNYMEKYHMLDSGSIEEQHMRTLDRLTLIHSKYTDAAEQCASIAGICHLRLTKLSDESVRDILFTSDQKIYLHEDVEELRMSLGSVNDRLNTPFKFVNRLDIDEVIVYECDSYFNHSDYTPNDTTDTPNDTADTPKGDN